MATCTNCGRAQPAEHVLEDRCVGCSLAVRQTLLQRRANALNSASPAGPAAEEIRAAAQRHFYLSMDPAPAPAPEGRPC